MSIVPVIGRELRSQARQPLTFLLRLAAVAAIGLAFWLAFSSLTIRTSRGSFRPPSAAQKQDFQNFGAALFGKMNLTIFVAIWLLTPLAAADSISRERREGTLPLLQLTRLRPWEIVLGKSFVHMLRSSTVFLTMAPWLCIPILFGGIGLQDLKMALVLDVSALLLAQSAGLLASTFSRDWLKAVIWAEAIALLLLLGMMSVHEIVLQQAFSIGTVVGAAGPRSWGPPQTGLWAYMYAGSGFIDKHSVLLGLLTNGSMEYQPQWGRFPGGIRAFEFQSTWQRIWGALSPAGELAWFSGSLVMLAGSVGVFVISVLLGAGYVRRSWREEARSGAWERLREKYFTPKYGVKALRKRLSRSLSRNPIGWLHHYSPSARLTKWSWCLFLIAVEMFFVGNINDIYTVQVGVGFLLLLGLLFSSTGSFRNELETGAFELLLVTPIREAQILFGRVSGIWQQFLPAFVIYGAGAIFLESGWSGERVGKGGTESVKGFLLLFVSAPIIGLYFSLLRWNFLVAWICASMMAMLLPVFVGARMGFSRNEIVIGQLCVAAFFAWRIYRRLQNRLALSPVTVEAG